MKNTMYLKENRHSTWLELFFDLSFVVALGKVTHLLAYTEINELLSHAFLTFALLFLPFWWIWVLHTSFFNRYDNDSRFHRIYTLLIMFLLTVLSTTIGSGIEKNYIIFIIVYSVVKLITAKLYAKDKKNVEGGSSNKRITWVLSLGTLLALSGIFFSFEIAGVLLTASIFLEIIVIQTSLISTSSTKPVDKEHLVERIGLLAIVLLGESIISVTSGLTEANWTLLTISTAIVGFSIIAMIWWIYFDSLDLLIESKKDAYGTGIIYSQLLVYMSFAILANTIGHAILNDLNLLDFRIMAISGMLLLYIGKQTAYAINVPKHNRHRIINTLIVLTIAVLSLLFNKAQFILFGLAISFATYIVLNSISRNKILDKVNL